MKKIKLFWNEKIPNVFTNHENYIFNKYSSRLFRLQNNKYYFSSLYKDQMEEIQVEFIKIDFQELFVEKFINILQDIYIASIHQATNISNEPVGPLEVNTCKIYDMFYALLYKQTYETDNLWLFTARLFSRLISSHPLKNGNKRTALMFLIKFVNMLGFYFKWTDGLYKNYSRYDKIISDFADGLSHKEGHDPEKTIKEIARWIEKNVIISMKWV